MRDRGSGDSVSKDSWEIFLRQTVERREGKGEGEGRREERKEKEE